MGSSWQRKMAGLWVKAVRGWSDLALSVGSAVPRLPRLIRVRGSHYGPEYRDPQTGKAHSLQPLAEVTEEQKFEGELKKTQLIKAAPVMKTGSVREDPLISKFANMMRKRSTGLIPHDTQTLEAVTRKPFENHHAAFSGEQATIERNLYTIFLQALKNCEAVIGLVPVLMGGHFHQVPLPLSDQRCRFLAIKWMITECTEKKQGWMLMPEKLWRELLEAFHNQGPVIKRKHDMHKMAEANRALAHYRWW